MADVTIFSKIIDKAIPANVIFEDDKVNGLAETELSCALNAFSVIYILLIYLLFFYSLY